MTVIENLWAISATLVHHTSDSQCVSVSITHQVPTFYLNGDDQGITTQEQAIAWAKRIILPVELDYDAVEVHAHAEKL